MKRFSLEGRVALVTGGATGIGRAIAVALAEAGADVAVTEHQRSADDTLKDVEALGRRGTALPCDLSSLHAAGTTQLFGAVKSELGNVSILVNNAGIIHRAEAEDYGDEEWNAVLEVNINAAWRLAREAGRQMLEAGRGKIINIASLLSLQGGIRVPAYTASKHAVVGMTKALANEWTARGVNVNAIAPGYIATANTRALRENETRNRQILERIPAGRWGEPEDLGGAAVFLASQASDYVSGHVLTVDGGWMAR